MFAAQRVRDLGQKAVELEREARNRASKAFLNLYFIRRGVSAESGIELYAVRRINSSRTAFPTLSKIWTCSDLNSDIKLKLFCANTLSTLLHGRKLSSTLSREMIRVRVTFKRVDPKEKVTVVRLHIKEGQHLHSWRRHTYSAVLWRSASVSKSEWQLHIYINSWGGNLTTFEHLSYLVS